MDERGNAVKAEKILLGTTALFLLLLLGLFLRDRAALRSPPVDPEMDSAVAEEPLLPQSPLDINTASAEALAELPGIGEVLAKRIVDYRGENGPFQKTEDLMEVPGIGEAKLAGLEGRITAGKSP